MLLLHEKYLLNRVEDGLLARRVKEAIPKGGLEEQTQKEKKCFVSSLFPFQAFVSDLHYRDHSRSLIAPLPGAVRRLVYLSAPARPSE